MDVATVCSLASLLALGAGAVPPLDFASHFRLQYLAGLVPCIALGLALGRRGSVLVVALAALVHAAAVVRAAWPVPAPAAADGVPLRIVTSNLLATNADHDAQVRWLRRADPDLVAFQEYTPAWHRALSGALGALPHRHAVPIDGPFGIALYSRHPIVRAETVALGAASGPPAVSATVDVGGRSLEVLTAHPVPPLGAGPLASNARQARALAELARRAGGPLVVAGDLNLTPWSAAFRDLARRGGLSDVRRGRGVLVTWSPATGRSGAAALLRAWPTSLPIDHVLVGGGVAVDDAFVGEATGSDHRALVADLRVPRAR